MGCRWVVACRGSSKSRQLETALIVQPVSKLQIKCIGENQLNHQLTWPGFRSADMAETVSRA